MFVNKPIGDPLKRKQLKWLLAALGVVLVLAVLVLSFRLMREPAQTPTQPVSEKVQANPTQEEIQKQLEVLAKEDAENPTPKPTEADIQKQLEALAVEDAKNPAPKPTQEDIQKQLEALSKE